MTKPRTSAEKKRLRFSLQIVLPLLLVCLSVLQFGGGLWATLDYQLLDHYYQRASEEGHGPKPYWSKEHDRNRSTKVQYLLLDDNTPAYRMRLNKNGLNSDRLFYAKLNDALANHNPATVAYDIIFRYPRGEEDKTLSTSFEALEGTLFLPVAFELSLSSSDEDDTLNKSVGNSVDILRRDYLKRIDEDHNGAPFARVADTLA